MLEEHVDDLPVLRELIPELGLGDAVGQRPDEDLSGGVPWKCTSRIRGVVLGGAVPVAVRVAVGSWELRRGQARRGRLDVLPEHALVPRHGHLAGPLGAGEREHPVAAVLRVPGLPRRGEVDEGPLAARLAARLDEEVGDRPVLRELRPQLRLRDVVRQGADEDLPRALRRLVRLLRAVRRARGRRDRPLPKHPLVARQRHLARAEGPGELQDAVRVLRGLERLLRGLERDECPLATRLAVRLEERVLHLAVLGELRAQLVVGDAVRQRAHKNLLHAAAWGHRGCLRDAAVRGRHAVATHICRYGCRGSAVVRLRKTSAGRLVRRAALPEHALVLRQHHVARLGAAREDKHTVTGVLRALGLLRSRECHKRPLARGLTTGLDEDLLDLPVLGELCPKLAVCYIRGQRAHEDLPRCHAATLLVMHVPWASARCACVPMPATQQRAQTLLWQKTR
mmetsp:Transcript_121684/g.344841  ORF Transcript_121684/g.344841 Transcript_121684/m.344841 type:complete len:453 (-) Transcript_121684:19-1377(-)